MVSINPLDNSQVRLLQENYHYVQFVMVLSDKTTDENVFNRLSLSAICVYYLYNDFKHSVYILSTQHVMCRPIVCAEFSISNWRHLDSVVDILYDFGLLS
jgi:hypothetical protein